MKTNPGSVHAEPFFLQTGLGQRFCLFHQPHPGRKCQGAILYAHPFGDEMNKTRRMAAVQARAFAAIGWSVLQMDLFGCGDSSGEFRDARWDIWKQDLAYARLWLENRLTVPVSLWGLRLGALLALDFAQDEANAVDRIILWQPVISGETFLSQFLRLRMAGELFSTVSEEKSTGTAMLREQLERGETLEIAGYELAPELAKAVDGLKAAELAVGKSAVHWFETIPEAGRSMTPAGARIAEKWKQKGVDLHIHLIPCQPFWATQEISECAELISATTGVFALAA
jgi:exosortase A-associated hydrolase 2